MFELIKRLFGKSCDSGHRDLHDFMSQCKPSARKSVYLEAARKASAEQSKIMMINPLDGRPGVR